MKINTLVFTLGSTLLLGFFISNCKKDDSKSIETNISGVVQKGPFISGSSILMSELNSKLKTTGNAISSQVINSGGYFELNSVSVASGFVEFSANGFYFDEIKNTISLAPINLYALSDINSDSTVNINILTHLEKSRVRFLIENNMPFQQAKKTAQSEILSIFGCEYSDMDGSEDLDISINTESNAILLAVSLILQGNRNVGDLSELLSNISNDIIEDGALNNKDIITDLRNSTKELSLSSIRKNLQDRYLELGIEASIPDFEKYINNFLVLTSQKPTVSVPLVTDITLTSAALSGMVNPNSLSTIITFEYGLTNNYGFSALAIQSPLTGSTSVNISAEINELFPGNVYHFRVKAENSLGISYSDDYEFKTQGQVPEAFIQAATNIAITSVTLNGQVNSYSLNAIVTFEYDTSENYTNSITASQSPVNSISGKQVSADITGLISGTLYHFRIKAENVVGTTYSSDTTFRTFYAGETGTVEDFEGNTYKTIGIGSQMWMAENLKATRYSNGDIIQTTKPLNLDIRLELSPQYQWAYNGNENIVDPYGRLYTWYVVNDSRNVCPNAWHVPSDEEWTILLNYLGGTSVAGGKLKESGTLHWHSPNFGATNESGFNALPGGNRANYDGSFSNLTLDGYWWSSDENIQDRGVFWYLNYNFRTFYSSHNVKIEGYSVRCLMDN